MAKLKITTLQDKIEKFESFYDDTFCKIIYPDQSPEEIRNLGKIILKWVQSNTKMYPIEFCFYPHTVFLKLPENTSKDDILKIEKSTPSEFVCSISLYKSSEKKSKKMDVEDEPKELLDDSNLE